jgi:hypothetical protein
LTPWTKSQHTAHSEIDRKIGKGATMAFAFGSAGALLKAFVPTLPALSAHRGIAAAARKIPWRKSATGVARADESALALSPEAEAALATLDLLPDGPVDLDAAPRARLTPEVAARNFVRWAQALDLDGDYATRSVYALYCEFSEVDGRPPLRDTRFLPALAEVDGVAPLPRGKDKSCRLWRWTIEPAKPLPVAEAIADVWAHVSTPGPDRASAQALQATPAGSDRAPAVPAPAIAQAPSASAAPSQSPIATHRAPDATAPAPASAPDAAVSAQSKAREATAQQAKPAGAPAPSRVVEATVPVVSQAPATNAPKRAPDATAATLSLVAGSDARPAGRTSALKAQTSAGAIDATSAARPTRSGIVLPRFVPDAEHPFSPAGLREREKSARRFRLNAAASRKQRGGVRRAA